MIPLCLYLSVNLFTAATKTGLDLVKLRSEACLVLVVKADDMRKTLSLLLARLNQGGGNDHARGQNVADAGVHFDFELSCFVLGL